MLTAAAGYASGEAFLSGAIARPFSKGLLMWGKTNKFILTLSINWLTLMPEGVHGASAGRSFGCAQDDETGEAEEAAGVHRASADGSFASLRMTAGGQMLLFYAHRAVVWFSK